MNAMHRNEPKKQTSLEAIPHESNNSASENAILMTSETKQVTRPPIEHHSSSYSTSELAAAIADATRKTPCPDTTYARSTHTCEKHSSPRNSNTDQKVLKKTSIENIDVADDIRGEVQVKSNTTAGTSQTVMIENKLGEDIHWGGYKKRSSPIRKPKQSFDCFNVKPSANKTTRPQETSQRQGEERRRTRASGQRQSYRTKTSVLASIVESDDEFEGKRESRGQRKKKTNIPPGDRAISKSGYTCRGRVKQKAQKRVELVRLGERRIMKGWYNAGYIFPLGFKSKTHFRSSVNLDALCLHECEIIHGEFWPLPTFVITAHDRPEEKLFSKSCTGCWSLVLKRINDEITRRRKLGEKLPPPPKTAIAGPEYFGLIQPDILRKIESLDTEKKCELYWSGKLDRQAASENLSQRNGQRIHTSGRSRTRRRPEYISDNESSNEDVTGDDDNQDGYTLSKWSTIGRFDRYKKRCLTKGTSPGMLENDDNPVPDLIDLITMQPVVTPAISPYGHVMGMATWRAWLSENRICPFTRNPMSIEQCTVLTKNNFDKYRDKIVK